MNKDLFHLIAFVAALAALVVLVVTGHDNNQIVMALLAGIAGGSGGNTLGSAFTLPNAGPRSVQRGSASFGFLAFALVLGLFGLSVSGCSSFGSQTPTQKIELACASLSAGLKALTPLEQEGALSAAESDTIYRASQAAKPICGSPTIPTYDDVKVSALNEALNNLVALEAKYHVRPAN